MAQLRNLILIERLPLPIIPPNLKIGHEIDRGAWGVVHEGELDGEPVAVKKVHQLLVEAEGGDCVLRHFFDECERLKAVDHPHVIKFNGAFNDAKLGPILVMERMKETLRLFLVRHKGNLAVQQQIHISVEIAQGVDFLHQLNPPMVHRDLNDKNVMFTYDGIAKIGDFGQSKLKQDLYLTSAVPGMVTFMPPEALHLTASKYDESLDMFSLGVLLLEIGTQQTPMVGLMGIGTIREIKRRESDLKELEDMHPLKPIILACLSDDRKQRPTAAQMLNKLSSLDVETKEGASAIQFKKDEVTAAPVTTHNSTRDVEVGDIASQVLPAAVSTFNAVSQVVPLPPTMDLTAQVLHSSFISSSSASTQSAATVREDVGFTGQVVIPGERVSSVEETESLTLRIACTNAGNVSDEADMTRRTPEMMFSVHCGQNIRLAQDCCSAVRFNGFRKGILLSERKIPNDYVFEVRLKKMNSKWEGTISLGITTLHPSKACKFRSAAEIAHYKSDTWLLYRHYLYRNTKEVKDLCVDLSNCREGQTVGFFCSQDPTYGTDTWFLVLNGCTVHKLAVKVPRDRYAVVDVYGQCKEVELLPLRDATALKEEMAIQAKMKKGKVKEDLQEKEDEEEEEQDGEKSRKEDQAQICTITKWTKEGLLGRGGCGAVYLCKDDDTGKQFAVKLLDFAPSTQEAVKCLEVEIQHLKKLQHKRIVAYFGAERTVEQLRIFLEYMPGGSIQQLLQKDGKLNEVLTQKYARQILEGLAYLHDHKIVHRDIKGANILRDMDDNVKLADFGVSKQLHTITTGLTTNSTKGTYHWMSPEVILGKPKQTTKVDIWSVGCTVVEMLTAKPPMHSLEPFAAMFRIGNEPEKFRSYITLSCSERVENFLSECFVVKPKARKSAHELLEMPYMME